MNFIRVQTNDELIIRIDIYCFLMKPPGYNLKLLKNIAVIYFSISRICYYIHLLYKYHRINIGSISITLQDYDLDSDLCNISTID